MEPREPDRYIRIEINLRQLRWLGRLVFPCLLLGAAASELASENVTLSTYYPAPSGVYTKLITTGDATLARDGGNVGIGTPAGASYKLNVSGTANVSSNLTANGVYGNYVQSNGGIGANGTIWDPNGNMYANDYWIGSIGKWAHQLGGNVTTSGAAPGIRWAAFSGHASCNYGAGEVMVGVSCAGNFTCSPLCVRMVSR